MEILYGIYKNNNSIDKKIYNQIRKLKNDKSIIRYDTICRRFFNGDETRLKEAILNYNHRIKAVIPLKEKVDVYDIEVPKPIILLWPAAYLFIIAPSKAATAGLKRFCLYAARFLMWKNQEWTRC